jgi:hypothetical protein
MNGNVVPKEEGVFELPCGCKTERINGKFLNILCEEHELEYQEMLEAPVYFKKTKMRDSREI